jgi:hypothetical protein
MGDIPKILGWIRLWPCPRHPCVCELGTKLVCTLHLQLQREREREREIATNMISLSLSLHPNFLSPFLPRTYLLPIRMCPSWKRSIHVPSLASLNVEKRWRKNGAWQQNGRMESCLGAA